ncbi:MAG: flagellar biosynthesis protein FlhB [Opitutaceae bacterium]|jgi:flagellar biosynthetic protein FlhB
MDQADNDSKTQLPTERRQREALERGQVARSPELQVVAMLAAALGVFSVATATSVRDLAALSSLIWGDLAAGKEPFRALPVQVAESARLLAFVLAPVVLASLVAALLAGGLQTGFQLTPKALGMRFERLNPVAGFTRMFSRTTAIHGLADFGKTVGIGVVLWFSAQSLLGDPLFSAPVEAAYLGGFLQRATLEFLGELILALGVIAALSYAYERHRNFQEMKMTHQEVKEEHKQSEGDAFLKGAMRRMARRLMQRQMLDAVPTADVIITNPTHYAIALKYERGRDAAPVVLAKGENRFAQRIKALAAEHGVPMVENKPVARMLFRVGEVGESIPQPLYQAVAEILAFVYRHHRLYFHELRQRRAAAEGASLARVA